MWIHRIGAVAAVAALAACQGQQGNGASSEKAEIDSDAARFSYAVGADLGQSLDVVRDEVDLAALERGLRDAFNGEELALTEEERTEAKNAVSQRLQQQQAEEAQAQSEEALAKGKAFREENAARDGVEVTDSGLHFEVLEAGEGASPAAEDTVTVHYRGTLIDGTEFDSSYGRGEPATFPLNQVIAGWTEALQKMQEGGKARLVIPPELAYGERGAGGRIGPNETLVFEVELLSVEDDESGAADEAAENESAEGGEAGDNAGE